jgi:hypothetical protein
MKKVAKILALVVAVAMISTLAIGVSAAGNREATVEMFKFAFVEDRGDWYVDLIAASPIARPVAFAFNNFSVSTTGTLELFTPAVNGRIPPTVASAPILQPDGSLILAFAADANPACLTAVPWIARFETEGEGTVTLAGEIALSLGGTDRTFPVNVTIDNLPVVTETSPTSPVTSPGGDTPPAGDDTTAPVASDTLPVGTATAPAATATLAPGGVVGAPKGGVALAIIPTIIAAGAAIVASRKRK